MSQAKFTNTNEGQTCALLIRQLLLCLTIMLCTQFSVLQAQATLSIQGILKKTNGDAVSDGTYNMTFKLYNALTGGTALWTETQSGVEVSSGIYSALLGTATPLNVQFNEIYYLGVTIGSAELTPRIRLTSAPYALSLIGSTNQFPSSGQVKADQIAVAGGVVADVGSPGANGSNDNGYAFEGDKDSGLFSNANGQVSIYADNVKVMGVVSDAVEIAGTLTVSGNFSTPNLELPSGGKISYEGKSDWRLVYDDNLANGSNGWGAHNALSGQNNGWNNPTNAGAPLISGSNNDFTGVYMYPSDNNQVLKKRFDLSAVGDFTYIKVKFKYFFIDTWGFGEQDRAWAAFATSAGGSAMRVGWDYLPSSLDDTGEFTDEFRIANNFNGGTDTKRSDFSRNGEMTAHRIGNDFWLFIGAALDEDTNNERYGVGMIEVWVK